MELDEAAESVQGIIASARHQSLIAGDILSVSRFNKGLLTVTPVDIALLNELRTIMSMFEIQTRNNGISLRLHHGTNIDDNLSVSADPTRLNQILVNLISNSCRILETFDGPRSCVLDVRALRSAPSLGDFHPKTDPALELTVKEEIPADCPVGTEIWLLFLIRDTGEWSKLSPWTNGGSLSYGRLTLTPHSIESCRPGNLRADAGAPLHKVQSCSG